MYDWFKKMRKESPVYYDGEVWNVFTYNDCKLILNDFKRFSSAMTDYNEKLPDLRSGKITFAVPTRYTMLTSDPPLHDELRGMTSNFFNPANLRQLEGFIRETVDNLISNLDNEFDVIESIAVPLPVIIISKLLGIESDVKKIKEWSDIVALRLGKPTEIFRIGKKYLELINFSKNVINSRKGEKGDDITSVIANSNLSDVEKRGYLILLMIAGNETTTNLIGNAIEDLTIFKQWDYIRKNGGLKAVEEALRYSPPVMRTARITKEKVNIGGKEIEEGELIRVWIASANRDESVFNNPDDFIPDRSPNPHLSFGSGIHLCLGAPLARLEAKILLEELSRKMEITDIIEKEKIENEILNGYKKLVVKGKKLDTNKLN
ncbi:cytochrome P450 Cyp119 [Acidianus manzaensis]|uniref:Cytochrome n=1 Tax=Acidianus manzaensis TaxID=282676 RepID=A0A1W6JWR2_9CREN|nr:cytochrome P450 Cyp119 [Acidianus manzaensis]ARM74672.1 cytochrome [Acidianus manzaensis]